VETKSKTKPHLLWQFVVSVFAFFAITVGLGIEKFELNDLLMFVFSNALIFALSHIIVSSCTFLGVRHYLK